jgi:hypothetical protein
MFGLAARVWTTVSAASWCRETGLGFGLTSLSPLDPAGIAGIRRSAPMLSFLYEWPTLIRMLPAATCARGTGAGKVGAWNFGAAPAKTPPALTRTAAPSTPNVIVALRRTAAKRAAARAEFLRSFKGSLLIRKLPSPRSTVAAKGRPYNIGFSGPFR